MARRVEGDTDATVAGETRTTVPGVEARDPGRAA